MEPSKRNFIKNVGFLGATGLLAGTQSASGQLVTAGAKSDTVFNVTDYGAKGDGNTADSAAIQKALDEAGKVQGTVYFPSGSYKCHDLKVHPNTTVIADPQWAYGAGQGAILTIDDENADCVLDISQGYGCHIRGVSLRGNRNAEKNQHGIFQNHPTEFTKRENSPIIDEVSINGFSGHGVYLLRIWLFIIRHSIFMSNRWNGVCIRGWDGFVSDNQFANNGRCGFGSEQEGSMVMFSGNRVEWNREYGLSLTESHSWNVTGNNFDMNYGAGMYANNLRNSAITGNVFRKNGRKNTMETEESIEESCHLFLKSCRGISVTGNTGIAGRDEGVKSPYTPNYAFQLRDNDFSIITANAFWRGYLKEMILDKGESSANMLINNNIGSIYELP